MLLEKEVETDATSKPPLKAILISVLLGTFFLVGTAVTVFLIWRKRRFKKIQATKKKTQIRVEGLGNDSNQFESQQNESNRNYKESNSLTLNDIDKSKNLPDETALPGFLKSFLFVDVAKPIIEEPLSESSRSSNSKSKEKDD